ncbi:MAG: hypothetical protein GX220_02900 [Treponema sp.]|nr:hypothetical protein [Treponema sp.]
MVQIEGDKGTFTISNNTFTATLTESWNTTTKQWEGATGSKSAACTL